MTTTEMAGDTKVLDVRLIVPRERHPLIFQLLDGLAVGQTLEIVNDHDPLPLYYQIQATRPEQFGWSYLETGPDVWRVHATRTAAAPQSDVLAGLSLNAIVERYPQALPVLTSFGLDTCCGGALTLEQAAERHGIFLPQLRDAVQQAIDKG